MWFCPFLLSCYLWFPLGPFSNISALLSAAIFPVTGNHALLVLYRQLCSQWLCCGMGGGGLLYLSKLYFLLFIPGSPQGLNLDWPCAILLLTVLSICLQLPLLVANMTHTMLQWGDNSAGGVSSHSTLTEWAKFSPRSHLQLMFSPSSVHSKVFLAFRLSVRKY